MNRILHCENLAALRGLPESSAELIYIDPPFNTGSLQHRRRTKSTLVTAAAETEPQAATRTGFGARLYTTTILDATPTYADQFTDYLSFLRPRLVEAIRVLVPTGSLFVHIDPREVHYVKVLLDELFTTDSHPGRACFQNEIIWAYDYGARPSRRWPTKHDNLLWYTKHPKHYTFNLAATDRIPYMAPTLVGAEKAARGKTPTDVWWHTIVSPTGKEKTGYPTQKPLGILERIIRVHSNPGDTVLDFFAGSGTTGVAAARNGRKYLLIDESKAAVALMQKRLAVENEEQSGKA